jgi:hypothetical protein
VKTNKEIKFKGETFKNRQYIADSLNSFFISAAENKNIKTNNKSLEYLQQAFDHFP